MSETQLPILEQAENSLAWIVGSTSNSDLAEFLAEHKRALLETLYGKGALLFRDFLVPDAVAFERAVHSLRGRSYSYIGGGAPRSRVTGEVYTSTDYAQSVAIALHCEATYFKDSPEFVWFFCSVPPEGGGETPLGDMRRVLEHLDDRVVNRFAEKGLLYVSNLHGGHGLGMSWQRAYQSENREEVEERIRLKGLDFEWIGNGSLRGFMRAPGLRNHSVTGELYWGNQAINWHPAALPAGTASVLARTFPEPISYPKMAFFGDGSAIADADVHVIMRALADAETVFEWKVGDVILVDNQAIAHGRRPFKGKRQILVALT